MRQTRLTCSENAFPLWLSRIRTCVLSVPLLIVSCGTAPHLALHEQMNSSYSFRKQPILKPIIIFFRVLWPNSITIAFKALEAYQAGLTYDPDSIFLKFRIAKLHFGLAQMPAAVEMAQQIPVEKITTVAMFLEMAKIFFDAGEHSRAQQVLAEGERKFPSEERLYISHGTLLLTKRRLSGSRRSVP